jgi:hypothetical protein
MNIFTWKLVLYAAPCDKSVHIVVSESARHGTERFQGEDKLCLRNESEVLADNIGLGKVSKTENDIFEFDEFQFMDDYPSESRVVKYWTACTTTSRESRKSCEF